MPTSVADSAGQSWGDGKITAQQAHDFAKMVTPMRGDQEIVARNLLTFPSTIRVRGIFFEGLSRVVGVEKGKPAMAELLAHAGITTKTTAFRAYPHRDFYKLYYLAARLLYPATPLATAMRNTARTFFPIFKSSLLGRTMSALMGDRPKTILPLLARAYNVSVEGNEHVAELKSDQMVEWSCNVEPVDGYVDIFTGIIEGAMPADIKVRVSIDDYGSAGELARYKFRIEW